MLLPNLAPMCPEINVSSVDVHSRGQGRGYPTRTQLSDVIETCQGHADMSASAVHAIDGRTAHVGHRN
ncbi:hypothetical protein BKM03_23300 [Pseudomonas avellanae]|uniref:Uncharacterized protein n=2 Tax=Pseudomonas syringae group TaxID=136849 RepID=A0AAD0E1C7_9PSED|nr:hypothetical protein BKM03_23300 [Pseudomonas avellanae]POP85139.1 hypothetical protein CXB34_18555 [Pseudomonas amygdali pv. morsprunorum]GGJ29090.1 hypothetical protein GCM10009085_24070 [Pseudomonas avellanae]SOS35800.1 hypothetical protein CFBP6411_04443 [Pseudomonas syringae group genomosp. 3]SPF20006.1 hypothetical protein PSCFBP3800_04551 [Pseudomonas syringae group genomosp. 3]